MTKSSSRAVKPLLRLRRVSKTYPTAAGLFYALKNINLDIFPGQFVSITGPSGSGKSTLMHIIGLLDTVSSGQVYLQGKNISRLSQNQLAQLRNQKIGFVFQQFNLLAKTTSLENISLPLLYSDLPKKDHFTIARRMLLKVGLGDKLKNTPGQLSGGQQQRVAIARALVNNPKIILADEPTGNLDSLSGQSIIKLLHQLHAEGRTIILVTHDASLAAQAQKIINIIDGQIHF